jgi:hypothetical protein
VLAFGSAPHAASGAALDTTFSKNLGTLINARFHMCEYLHHVRGLQGVLARNQECFKPEFLVHEQDFSKTRQEKA